MKTVFRLAMALLLVGAVAGCGKKGPPMLPKPHAVVTIENLLAEYRAGEGVVLNWRVGGNMKNVTGFLLFRGLEKIGETVCRSCDEFYHPLDTPPMADMKGAGGGFSYTDRDITPGYRYYYKVEPAYDNGSMSEGALVSADVP